MTDRWRVALAATLTLTAISLLYAEPVLLTAAVIPLMYVLYGEFSRVPASAAVDVSRSFDASDPAPGDPVGVTLTVRNDCDRVLTDLRLIDGVPEELAVTDGSPRVCLALRPGESATLSYVVVAKRGEYDFADPVVRLRSLAGGDRTTAAVDVAGDEALVVANTVTEPPVGDATLPRAGTLPTDSGGAGIEFFATRQYRPSDPMTRVDWRHYAKTGEFVTVQYREEQAIRTVLVVDARQPGRVTPAAGYPTGAELSAYAGERIYEALRGAGLVTSVTAVGLDDPDLDGLVGPDGIPWVDSEETGRAARAETVFRSVQRVAERDAGGQAVADGGPADLTERLLGRLPPNAQVVVCTPLLDEWPVRLAEELSVRGYSQVVVSPTVTTTDTVGQRLTAVERRLRLDRLRGSGAATVSWGLDEPIDYALQRSLPHLL